MLKIPSRININMIMVAYPQNIHTRSSAGPLGLSLNLFIIIKNLLLPRGETTKDARNHQVNKDRNKDRDVLVVIPTIRNVRPQANRIKRDTMILQGLIVVDVTGGGSSEIYHKSP